MKRLRRTRRSEWQYLCRAGRWVGVMLAVLVCMVGCKTSRQAEPVSKDTGCLSAKVQLEIPTKNAVFTVNGTLRMKSGDRMQLSFLMPILRTEVARIDISPDEILLVDRMGKRYVRATRSELGDMLPEKVSFASLEKLLYEAAQSDPAVLTGEKLGIPSLEKGRLTLSGFSGEAFMLTPTQLSAKYKEVELHELLEMLMSL